MQVLTYNSTNAPPKMAWLAQIVTADGVHPVYFHGLTEEIVRAAAEKWWADQTRPDGRRGPKKAKVAATVDNSEEAI